MWFSGKPWPPKTSNLSLASSSSLALGGGGRGGLGKRPCAFLPPVLFVIGPCGLGHINSQPLLQRMKWPGEKQVCPRWAGEDERTQGSLHILGFWLAFWGRGGFAGQLLPA